MGNQKPFIISDTVVQPQKGCTRVKPYPPSSKKNYFIKKKMAPGQRYATIYYVIDCCLINATSPDVLRFILQ